MREHEKEWERNGSVCTTTALTHFLLSCFWFVCEQKAGVQWIGAMLAALALTGFYKRFRWAPVKTNKYGPSS